MLKRLPAAASTAAAAATAAVGTASTLTRATVMLLGAASALSLATERTLLADGQLAARGLTTAGRALATTMRSPAAPSVRLSCRGSNLCHYIIY